LGDYSFYGCTGITELTIGTGVTSIGDYSFWNCPVLSTVHFNAENCTEMYTNNSGGLSVFNSGTTATGSAAITTLTIGNGVNRIPNYAFRKSSGILGVSFPQWLTNIGNNAFSDCENLASITLLSTTPPSVGSNAFNNVPLTIPVFVPCNLSGDYAAAGGWNQFSNIIELCSNQIIAVAYPSNSGTVTGSGTYAPGQICFLTAIPNSGYSFIHWRKNGEIVSTNSTYNFTVIESGSYVAIFRETQTFTVLASINPSEGGNVTGAGFYNQGQTCTLTAIPNEGYTFVNWTEDGVAVSTSASYSFTVTGNRNLVANFMATPVNCIINASASPSNGGTVTGAGTYPLGQVCTLTASANAGYTFVNWTEGMSWEAGGEVVSTSATFSFTVTGNWNVVANFTATGGNITQTTNLTAGWNWWSSYIELSGIDGLEQMETSLGDNGIMIKSRDNGFVTNYGSTWLGNLLSVNNVSTYLIQTGAACEMTIAGETATPSNHPIALTTGWSWIGYPCGTQMSIGTALSCLTPLENDQLKSRESFSVYYPGVGWLGTLQTIIPGMGLMFESHNTNTVTLTYPNSAKFEEQKENITASDNHWKPAMQSYPDNMAVLAVIELDDVELQDENYELAAFANGECRGSAKLMYVEALNRYMAFMIVYGEMADELRFGLYNAGTGEECFDTNNSLTYTTNATEGNIDEPFVISFRSTVDVEEWENSLKVYPNPVEHGQILTLGLMEETDKVQVEIVNAIGVVERRWMISPSVQTTISAPDVAGIYTLRITVEGKGICYRKLIVK
jgi:hypothetical protein